MLQRRAWQTLQRSQFNRVVPSEKRRVSLSTANLALGVKGKLSTCWQVSLPPAARGRDWRWQTGIDTILPLGAADSCQVLTPATRLFISSCRRCRFEEKNQKVCLLLCLDSCKKNDFRHDLWITVRLKSRRCVLEMKSRLGILEDGEERGGGRGAV